MEGQFKSLCGLVVVAALSFASVASAYEAVPEPWIPEAVAHSPGMPPPPPEEAASSPPPDETAPGTFIDIANAPAGRSFARLFFSSNETGSTFKCKLDRRPAAKCSSPQSFGHLSAARHVIRVSAVDASGNADPSPAIFHFRIKQR
jgi:hypothetical protein